MVHPSLLNEDNLFVANTAFWKKLCPRRNIAMKQISSLNLMVAKLANAKSVTSDQQSRTNCVAGTAHRSQHYYHYCCAVFSLLLLTSASAIEHNNGSYDNSNVRTVTVNAGENVSLVCSGTESRTNETIFWIHDTKDSERILSGSN